MGGEPAVVGGEVVVADVEVSALGLCFLALECAALDLTVVVVVERILGLVVVVVTRGFGLVVVVVEWDLVVEAFFFDGPLVVGGDLVVGADLVVGGDLVVVGADLVVEGFFLDGPLVVGGDLVVGGAFVVEGDLAAGRGVERPLFLNGARSLTWSAWASTWSAEAWSSRSSWRSHAHSSSTAGVLLSWWEGTSWAEAKTSS